jgi:kynurenine formamidase
MAWIDLSMTITHHMPVYPHDAKVELKASATTPIDGFSNSVLRMGMHVGTHIDGTLHMKTDGVTIDKVPLERLTGEAVLIDAFGKLEIDLTHEIAMMDLANKIVLVYTGFSAKFGCGDYFTNHPVLTLKLAEYFTAQKVKMVGLDFPSPDRAPFEVHHQLFDNNIIIAENLVNLNMLLNKTPIEIVALPLKILADSAPARIIARA